MEHSDNETTIIKIQSVLTTTNITEFTEHHDNITIITEISGAL